MSDDTVARVASEGVVSVVPAAIALTGAGLALEAGGYFPRAWIWSGVVLLWIAALAAAFRTPLSIDRRAAVFLSAMALFTGWTLLSATWSVEPQQTFLEARRDVVYLGVAAAAILGCSRLAAWHIPGAVLAASTLIASLGVGRYLLSGPVDPFQKGLLSWPVGYANGFAAISAVSLPLALGLAAHGRRADVRSAAAAAIAPLLAVLLVTSSRGGVLATAAGLVAVLLLDPRRRALIRTALRLALPAAVLVGVGVWADLPNATLTGGDTAGRRAALGVTAVAVAAVSAFLVRSTSGRRRGAALPRSLALAFVLLSVLLGAVVTALPELGGERTSSATRRSRAGRLLARRLARRHCASVARFGRRHLRAGVARARPAGARRRARRPRPLHRGARRARAGRSRPAARGARRAARLGAGGRESVAVRCGSRRRLRRLPRARVRRLGLGDARGHAAGARPRCGRRDPRAAAVEREADRPQASFRPRRRGGARGGRIVARRAQQRATSSGRRPEGDGRAHSLAQQCSELTACRDGRCRCALCRCRASGRSCSPPAALSGRRRACRDAWSDAPSPRWR